MSDEQLDDERIAIIGMAGRFPGAGSVNGLWQNLLNGVESIRRFEDDELRARGVTDTLLADPRYVKAGTVLDDVEMFDAAFFGLSPREAALMDPQQRLFLQASVEALEDAGHMTDGPLAAGVFAGIGQNGYLPGRDCALRGDHALEHVKMIGNEKDYLAARVAYHLNLTGPVLVVQSACSTSLVAVHLACHSLLTYQCDLALAGAVGILLPQGQGYLHQDGMLLSPDGHCRAFDARAAGYVHGRGLGVVVLKRLSEALEDGDRIDAVIRASAVNNDGALKVGFAAFSVEGQAEVVASALALADIPAETVRYVEAFGSGTLLGDAIEIEALVRAFRAQTGRTGFCRIGSIKTNIGHLDTAAGIAGLVKAALVLKTGRVPPTLHFETPNPEIDFARTPFVVASELATLERGAEPLRAGVSSFGIGGTNAHVILEEPPVAADDDGDEAPETPALVVLSAKTREALDEASGRLADHLEAAPDTDLGDVAWTLQVGRRHYPYRRMLVAHEVDDVVRELRRPWTPPAVRSDRTVVFMCPGARLDDPAPLIDLFRQEPVFREGFLRCADAALASGGPDLRQTVHGARGASDPRQNDVLLFALEHALANYWITLGIRPALLLGDGLGLLVAACLADMVSLEEALGAVVAESAGGARSRPALTARRAPSVPVVALGGGGSVEAGKVIDPAVLAGVSATPEELHAAFRTFLEGHGRVLLEVGPPGAPGEHTRAYESHGSDGERTVLSSLPTCAGPGDPVSHLRRVIGQLWLAGLEPDWKALHQGRRRQRVGLPTYPFARTPHWLAAGQTPRPPLEAVARDGWELAGGTAAPGHAAERTFALILADVLGMSEVGPHDDFFALGGDSLLALSVMARAREAGLHVSPQQIVRTPTAAGLAAAAARTASPASATSADAGKVPLTPFLARFLRQRGEQNPHRWNLSAVVECRRLEPVLLDRALASLQERHDSLRLRVVPDAGGWRAFVLPVAAAGTRPLEVADFADLADEEVQAAIEARAEEVQRGLHLGRGPIVRAVVFELGPMRLQRLLLVVHHFALDGFAWMVLFQDLERTYAALESGLEPPDAPAAGMKAWAEELERFATDEARGRDLEAWLALPWKEVRPLPLDHVAGPAMNTNASAAAVARELSQTETGRLLRAMSRGFSPETVMIAALARSLARLQASSRVLIERLFQGRNVTGSPLDLASSLGSFLCYAPCLLEVDPDGTTIDILRSVSGQLEGPAGLGAAIDLVRFMDPARPEAAALEALPRAEVLFNYRGKVDGTFDRSLLFSPAGGSAGSDYDPDGRRYYPLAVRADIVGGRLDLRIVYSRNLHERATIEALARDLIAFIRTTIDDIDL